MSRIERLKRQSVRRHQPQNTNPLNETREGENSRRQKSLRSCSKLMCWLGKWVTEVNN